MSKLLLDEYPLIVLPSLACLIGDRPAIFLQQIHYWCQHYKKQNSLRHYHNGRWWVWNSAAGWKNQFPFWSVRTITRIIRRLRTAKLILTSNYNLKAYDRTNWYTVDYDALDDLMANTPDPTPPPDKPTDQLTLPFPPTHPAHGPVEPVNLTECITPKGPNGSGQNGAMDQAILAQPIPETTMRESMENTWFLLLDELKHCTTRQTYDTYLSRLTATIDNNNAYIHCPEPFVLDWCQHRLHKLIATHLRSILANPDLQLIYTLAPYPAIGVVGHETVPEPPEPPT